MPITDPMTAARGEPELASLQGKKAPAGLSRDLSRISVLPAAARQRFWQILPSILEEPIPQSAERTIDDFAKSTGTAKPDLAPALASARFLVRAASLVDATREQLASDVAALTDGNGEIVALLLAGFDTAKEIVRAKVKLASLASHGKVLEGVDWRIDVVTSSSQGGALNLPVALLTFRYREGDKHDRITLQLTAESVAELRKVCEQISK